MSQITFDYSNTIAKANDLNTIAATMQSQSCKEIEEIIKNIEASWSGNSAKLFIMYLSDVSEQLKNQGKYLAQCSDYLHASAKKMQQAEAAAANAVQRI